MIQMPALCQTQHDSLDFYSTSLVKQLSAVRHVASLGRIILIPNRSVLFFLFNAACLAERSTRSEHGNHCTTIHFTRREHGNHCTTIHFTRREHGNHYTTDISYCCVLLSLLEMPVLSYYDCLKCLLCLIMIA